MIQAAPRDRWLFLTPEAEAELPAAVAALAAALDEPARGAGEEAERLERIILDGAYRDWLLYLRERRRLLERYVQRVGPDALAGHVAALLNEQYQLALTVTGCELEADAERERVARLLRSLRGPLAR